MGPLLLFAGINVYPALLLRGWVRVLYWVAIALVFARRG